MILNGDFSQFDYRDKAKNREVYGRDTPPPYNLTAITAPVHLYYSKNDDTAIIENAIKLRQQLPNVKSSYRIPIGDFGHVDYTSVNFFLVLFILWIFFIFISLSYLFFDYADILAMLRKYFTTI